jgi:nitric oxide reductase subunit B
LGATTDRPGQTITYTSNWPHEPLVGNSPTTGTLLWSLASVILLLAAAGALHCLLRQAVRRLARRHPARGRHGDLRPSGAGCHHAVDARHREIFLGGLRAVRGAGAARHRHRSLCGRGQGLYGLPFAEYLPYTITRTWHTQLAVLWIATAWLATGLYVAPMLAGRDPRFQRLGVNFLFVSLLVIVIGSFAGQWAAVHRFFGDLTVNFWFGHQGYEYVDLGRFWQIYLLIGLFLWVALVVRALWPVLRREGGKSLIYLVLVSALAIGLLYGAGLMWGQHTNIAVMEYWRWWVVHLWVEGIFEVFATGIISLLFVQMGILRTSTATVMVLFATIIFLFGGVLGTFHHLYFSGTPTSVIAVGAMISALEVVPLLVVGFKPIRGTRSSMRPNGNGPITGPSCSSPLSCSGTWSAPDVRLPHQSTDRALLHAGLNTTANHGHAALFGVYGMLGLGLTLYCMRGLTDVTRWNQKWIKISFWSLNIGLGMMTFLSLLRRASCRPMPASSMAMPMRARRSSSIARSCRRWSGQGCPAMSSSPSVSSLLRGSCFGHSCRARTWLPATEKQSIEEARPHGSPSAWLVFSRPG